MAEANNSRVAADAAWENTADAPSEKGRRCGRLLCAVHCSLFCSWRTMFWAHNNRGQARVIIKVGAPGMSFFRFSIFSSFCLHLHWIVSVSDRLFHEHPHEFEHI